MAQTDLKILTANALLSGEVIYLGRNGRWVAQLHDAMLIATDAAANTCLAEAEMQAGTIVGPYLIGATGSAQGPAAPTHFREGFRMRGPSNQFHGKQAEIQI